MMLAKAGVRQVIVSGIPLTGQMPYIANNEALASFGGIGASTARLIMRHCNALFLASIRRSLAKVRDVAGLDVLCLDEASAIEQIISRVDGPPHEHYWWDDVSHPSERLHSELARMFAEQICAEQKLFLSKAAAPDSNAHGGAHENDVLLALPKTPSEREIIANTTR